MTPNLNDKLVTNDQGLDDHERRSVPSPAASPIAPTDLIPYGSWCVKPVGPHHPGGRRGRAAADPPTPRTRLHSGVGAGVMAEWFTGGAGQLRRLDGPAGISPPQRIRPAWNGAAPRVSPWAGSPAPPIRSRGAAAATSCAGNGRGGPGFLLAPGVLRHRVLDGEPDRGGHAWRHAGITGKRRSTRSSSRSRDGDSWLGRASAWEPSGSRLVRSQQCSGSLRGRW